jgi:hypothetical protein
MKKGLLFFFTALLLTLTASAQNNELDKVFDRYSSVEGATHMNLSGDLIDMILKSSNDKNMTDAEKKITHLQLLTFSGSHDTDFFQSVTRSLTSNKYTELMRIHDAGEHFVLLADMDEKFISELILVAGGDENVLIHIRGKMSMDDIEDFSGGSSSNFLGSFGFGL